MTLRTKIQSNLTLYRQELTEKGISHFIIARIIKFPTTRAIYNLLKPSSVSVGKHTMFIDKHDMFVSQVLYTSHIWDAHATSVFKLITHKNDVFLDIGAHIGYYTLLGADIVGPKGQVYAFEPDSNCRALLKKNVETNHFTNVTIVSKAVSDTSGTAKLFLNKENTGDNRLFKNTAAKKAISIETVKLDELFKNKKIDVIKIDIQGAEMLALRGMETLLKRNPSCKLLIEYWPEGLRQAGTSDVELLKFLKRFKYTFYLLDEDATTTRKIAAKDLLSGVKAGSVYDANLLCFREDLNPSLAKKLS